VIEDFGIFTDPSDPQLLTGYVIGNPSEGAFGAPYEAPKRYYRAVELTLQRAKTNNWQLLTSFVYAKAKGNYEGLYISGYDQLDPNITALYDIPSFLSNAYGTLRADKPYQFKVHGAYTFPFGLTVSEGFFLSAGIPISAQGPEIYNGYGDGTIWMKTRGSRAARAPTTRSTCTPTTTCRCSGRSPASGSASSWTRSTCSTSTRRSRRTRTTRTRACRTSTSGRIRATSTRSATRSSTRA
jgi:hypothetical protein